MKTIAETAVEYARAEMGREVRIAATLDCGSSAMALCIALDGDEDFALVLAAAIATHVWAVVAETDVADYRRNDPDAPVPCWCGMTVRKSRLHYPGGDPECGAAHRPASPCEDCGSEPHPGPCHTDDDLPPGYDDVPPQCHECAAYAVDGTDGWTERTVDLDPGNAEVGPDPHLCVVVICPTCAAREVRR